jgi:ABC-type uncharacterized transport system substrate-binding protein
MLFNPASAPYTEYWLNPFKAAAARFAVEAISASVRDASELDSVIAAQAREPNSGLIAMPDSFTIAYRLEIILLADRYRLPAVYPFRFFAEVGGLLSYGVDLVDNYRRVATYADRILKGENPSELPVQAPVKFELVINPWTVRKRIEVVGYLRGFLAITRKPIPAYPRHVRKRQTAACRRARPCAISAAGQLGTPPRAGSALTASRW